jgi:peptide/nickel transport system substrate-binding protein
MKTANYDTVHMGNSVFGRANLVRACVESVYKLCPGLAESWEHNATFTQWTFKVRDNVFWHDGTAFTAADVKFWMELAFFGTKSGKSTRVPAWYQADLGDLQKVEVLESNRVRITLGRSAPQYLYGLTDPRQTVSHPKHLMQPFVERGEVNVAPQDVGWVGTGPFKVLKYEKGTRAQVRRFDRFWEKDVQGRQLPYLDGIDFAILRDPAAMDAAFRVGRLDGGTIGSPYYLTPERKAGYVRDLGDQVWFAEIATDVTGLGLNVLKPGPLQDVRVRQALARWIDKPAFSTAIYGGFGFVGTILHPQNPFTNPDFMTWPGFGPNKERDRAEAKRLLAQAGYPNGFKMNFFGPQRFIPYFEFYQGQLAGLGVTLEAKISDEANYNAGRSTLDYDTLGGGIGGSPVIPEATETNYAAYSRTKVSPAKHEDPRMTELYGKLSATTDYNERVRIWRELERYYILEQAYYIPTSGQNSVIPYRSYVKGRTVPVERIHEYLDFVTVWVDK